MGRSIVRALVGRGDTVHFIGRRADRAASLKSELGRDAPRAHFHEVDLSDLAATRSFARGFAAEVDRLDVLANVAGVILRSKRITSEALEYTAALGVHSPFVLSTLLRPALDRAVAPRIVNVSGAARVVLRPRFDFDDTPTGLRAAVRTVHAKTVLTQALAARWPGIDVNAFHPGRVKSDLGRNLPGVVRWAMHLAGPLMDDVSSAGIAAARDAPSGLTGQLFTDTRPQPLIFDKAYVDRVWAWNDGVIRGVLGSWHDEQVS